MKKYFVFAIWALTFLVTHAQIKTFSDTSIQRVEYEKRRGDAIKQYQDTKMERMLLMQQEKKMKAEISEANINSAEFAFEGIVIRNESYLRPDSMGINRPTISQVVKITNIFRGNLKLGTIELISKLEGNFILTEKRNISMPNDSVVIFFCRRAPEYSYDPQYNVEKVDNKVILTPIDNACFRRQSNDGSWYGDVLGFQTTDSIYKYLRQFKRLKIPVESVPYKKKSNELKLIANSNVPMITAIEPLNLIAGRDQIVTIKGSGFGSKRGDNGCIWFTSADDANLLVRDDDDYDYLINNVESWKDDEIKIKLPSRVVYKSPSGSVKTKLIGSGNIKITNNLNQQSEGYYCLFNQSFMQFSSIDGSVKTVNYIKGNNANNDGIIFRLDESVKKYPNAIPLIRRALAEWSCKLNISLSITEDISIKNLIKFESLNPDLKSSSTDFMICNLKPKVIKGNEYCSEEVIISIDPNVAWDYSTPGAGINGYDFYGCLLHEIGHSLMLSHNNSALSLMFFYTSQIFNESSRHGLSDFNLDVVADAQYVINQSTAYIPALIKAKTYTSNCPTVLAVPSPWFVFNSNSSITLNWVVVPDAQSYTVEFSTISGTNYSVVGSVNAPNVSFTATGLSNPCTYHYRVKANNQYGSSAYSSEVIVSTSEANALIADFTHELDQNTAYKVNFKDCTISGSPIMSREWSFGDTNPLDNTSTSTFPSHTYSQGGNYEVVLKVTSLKGETKEVRKTISVVNDVKPNLKAIFSASLASGQAPLNVNFNSEKSSGTNITRTWSITPNSGFVFLNGTNNQSINPSIRFDKIGSYSVSLTVKDGAGSSSTTQNIEVATSPWGNISPNFYWPTPVYAGLATKFTNSTTGGCLGGTYTWTFNDFDFKRNDYMENPMYVFSKPGTYNVELCVEGGCGETGQISKSVTVVAPQCNLNAKFIGGDFVVRQGQSVTFGDDSSPFSNIKAWSWYFDWDHKGSEPDLFFTQSNYKPYVTHQFNEIGEFKVKLYVHDDLRIACQPFEKTVKVIKDWGVDVPTQTESQIIISGVQWHAISDEGSVSGDYMVASLKDSKTTFYNIFYLYKRINNKWSKIAELSNSDGSIIDEVSIDGNTIVASSDRKKMYVYEKPVGEWANAKETTKISESYDKTQFYRSKFSINKDRIFTILEKRLPEYPWIEISSCVIYKKKNGIWSPIPTTIDFRSSLISVKYSSWNDFSIYDNTLVVGFEKEKTVLIYECVNDQWIFTARLESPSAGDNFFGCSVATNGNTIVVGAEYENRFGKFENYAKGAAYVYEKPTSGWCNMSPTGKLSAFDGKRLGETHEFFGHAVAIDGDKIAIFSGGFHSNNNRYGGVYLFEKPSEGWTDMTETIKLIGRDANHSLGTHVDNLCFSNGRLLLFNDSYNPNSPKVCYDSNRGAIYCFDIKKSYSQCYNEYNKSDFVLKAGTYDDVSDGIINLGGGSTGAIFNSNVKIKYEASNGITLKPGVHVQNGSNVTFSHIDCALLLEKKNSGASYNAPIFNPIDTAVILPSISAHQTENEPGKIVLFSYNDIDEPFDIEVEDAETGVIVGEFGNLKGNKNSVVGSFVSSKIYFIRAKRNNIYFAESVVFSDNNFLDIK